MFAARLRSSLQPFFHGRSTSSLNRSREIASISKRILHNRFNNGVSRINSFSTFHSSPQYHNASESDTVKTQALVSDEDEFLAELGSVEVQENAVIAVLTSYTKKSNTLGVEIPMFTQEAMSKKKKKKREEGSDLKLTLLTEKPEVVWKNYVKRGIKAQGSTPGKNVTDSNVSSSKISKSSSPTEAQNSFTPISEANILTNSESKSEGRGNSKEKFWSSIYIKW